MRPARLRVLTALVLVAAAFARDAYALDKHACVTASDRGQSLRIDGHLSAAREQLLVCADPSCPPMVRSSCAEWLTSLDAQLPTILFVVKDADGADVADATLTMDGRALVGAIEGRPVAIDPGTHALHVTSPNRGTIEQTLVVREGEVRRSVSLAFPRRARPSPRPAPAGPPPAAPTPWTAWGFVIGSGAALATFGGFALAGHLQYEDLESSCAPRCGGDRYAPVNAKFIVADIALGVAIVAGGIAAALFLTEPNSAAHARAHLGPSGFVF